MKIDKIVRIGRAPLTGNLFCHIKFADGRLSITGVEGPKRNGDCRGCCGQIIMSEWNIQEYAPGWGADKVQEFRRVWGRWHLNYARAGTRKQEQILKAHEADYPGFPVSRYEWACGVLREAGCYEDDGHRYGSAWLREDVPLEVLEWLEALPETDIQPAWV